jgi:predicted HTH domain antitoxin
LREKELREELSIELLEKSKDSERKMNEVKMQYEEMSNINFQLKK